MTSQSPRIYTYKITFEEVPYYYYGVHKEKKYDEEYWGTPVTHKWCWEVYNPKKQILEIFEFSDEGYIKAQEIEKRMIRPILNDKWCLNECCGGIISIKQKIEGGRKGGKIGGKIGGKNSGKKQYTEKKGIHGMTFEEKSIRSKRNGLKHKENKTGVCGRSRKRIIEDGKKGGKISGNQKWKCIETGFITNAGNLTKYQRARGIDTSKRIKL